MHDFYFFCKNCAGIFFRIFFRFTGIEGAAGRTFDWNPCTPFSNADGCNDVMVSKVLMKGAYEIKTK